MRSRPVGAHLSDPRSIVTPDAFSISPQLLGTPLAAPWRRLVALLIDLALIAVVGQLGWGVLGGVAAVIGLRLATRRGGGAPMGPIGRGFLGCASLFVFIVASIVTLFSAASVRDMLSNQFNNNPTAASTVDVAAAGARPALRDLLGGVAGAVELSSAQNEAEARDAAYQIGVTLRATGATRDDIEASLAAFTEENSEFDGAALAALVVDSLFAGDGEGGVDEEAGDDATAGLPPAVVERVEALEDSVSDLSSDLAQAEDERGALEAALEEAESKSTLFQWIRDAADEAGLILGWGTVYLTLFLVLWDGRTPGKKALDLRVVRLNGQPLGLYLSLERAGGYAAGVATGLLGFAQVWWDPNRQAIHDKIAETVVIREKLPKVKVANGGSGQGRPGLAINQET